MAELDSSIKTTLNNKSDYELYKLSIATEGEYTSESILYAQELLEFRKVPAKEFESFNKRIACEANKRNIKANTNAKIYEKIICFLFPGMLFFLVFGDLKAKGYLKKSRQLKLASRLGIAFYILLIALIII